MSLIPAKCTNCGGTLEVDSAKEAAICPHCGSAFITEKAVTNYNTYNQIQADTVIVQGERDFEVAGGVLKAYNGAAVDVVVPDGVYEIGKSCFQNMKIRSVVFSESVETIGYAAFHNCSNLQSVQFPENLKKIGNVAFRFCGSLQNVALPHGLQEIELGAFDNCTSLQSIHIPEKIKVINSMTFKGCTSLREVSLSEGLKNIEREAFIGCGNLREISLAEGLEDIGDEAFKDCTSLTSVVFPKTLKKIGSNAFENCTGLSSICFLGDFPEIYSSFKNCAGLEEISPLDHHYIAERYIGSLGNRESLPVVKKCRRLCEEEKKEWMRRKVCSYCGSPFKGAFKKVCSACGKPKNY